jgi:hypothetical protein
MVLAMTTKINPFYPIDIGRVKVLRDKFGVGLFDAMKASQGEELLWALSEASSMDDLRRVFADIVMSIYPCVDKERCTELLSKMDLQYK